MGAKLGRDEGIDGDGDCLARTTEGDHGGLHGAGRIWGDDDRAAVQDDIADQTVHGRDGQGVASGPGLLDAAASRRAAINRDAEGCVAVAESG